MCPTVLLGYVGKSSKGEAIGCGVLFDAMGGLAFLGPLVNPLLDHGLWKSSTEEQAMLGHANQHPTKLLQALEGCCLRCCPDVLLPRQGSGFTSALSPGLGF